MSNILNDNEIRLSGIIEESVVDGPGFRFVIFTQGCPKRCFMCHNSETQPIDGGYIEDITKISKMWQGNPLLKGITISGGEPFIQPEKVIKLVRLAKRDNLNVLLYSGFYYEELRKMKNEVNQILDEADYLVDGPYMHEKRDLTLLFRGSSNQRIIDLKKSKLTNNLVLIEEF